MLVAHLSPALQALEQRGAWMWTTSTHPYGAANIIGDNSKIDELIPDFGAWGFDRVYVSAGTETIFNPNDVAYLNSSLDSVGIESQYLFGLLTPNPITFANQVQSRVINFNNSRSDPSEKFDAVHLDIEPQGSSGWSSATPSEKRDMLLNLRDVYEAVRTQLDDNGAAEVKIYADLPVWFDSSSSIGWLDSSDRDQWFDDIAVSLDGITMMAFERDTLSSINSGVSWEVANFNGDVRIGLNVNEVGPGDTFEDYAEMMAMADSLEAFYGTDISGIDFQPFVTYVDLSPDPVFTADFDQDGEVNGQDYLSLLRNFGTLSGASLTQGDANESGSINLFDLMIWQEQFGTTALAAAVVVPEPTTLSLACILSFVFASMRFSSIGMCRIKL